jgi:PBP1b-binding outer membrane lipoprotein LpoB
MIKIILSVAIVAMVFSGCVGIEDKTKRNAAPKSYDMQISKDTNKVIKK